MSNKPPYSTGGETNEHRRSGSREEWHQGISGKNLLTGVEIDSLDQIAGENAIVTRIDPTAAHHPFPQLERA